MQLFRSILLLIVIACYVSNTAAKSKTVKDQVVDGAAHLKDNVVEGAKVAADAAKTASKWTGESNDFKREYMNFFPRFVEADSSK